MDFSNIKSNTCLYCQKWISILISEHNLLIEIYLIEIIFIKKNLDLLFKIKAKYF